MRKGLKYHEIRELEDGTRLGSVGAATFILGRHDYPISFPFHDIRLAEGKEQTGEVKYIAEIGGNRFGLDKNGRTISGEEKYNKDLGYKTLTIIFDSIATVKAEEARAKVYQKFPRHLIQKP